MGDLLDYLNELAERYNTPTEADYAWAEEVLGVRGSAGPLVAPEGSQAAIPRGEEGSARTT